MTGFIPEHNFDENVLQERLELFRYADLSQPLMQVLFTLQLPDEAAKEAE